jgi:hypothetical protein
VSNNDNCRDLAIFTIVQDEPEFIHAWVNHYKNQVAEARDIYVLVHTPTDANGTPIAPEGIPAWHLAETLLVQHHEVITVPVHHRLAFDHRWLADTVSRFYSFLLQSYRWVLFAEIDEFVLPTAGKLSKGTTLLDYVRQQAARAATAIRATGFEVIQQDGEPAVSPESYNSGGNISLTAGELLRARSWWRPSEQYSKTILGRTTMRWGAGFHKAEGCASEISAGKPAEDLVLVHLHRVDFGIALARLQRNRSRKWSQPDIENRWGWQNRLDSAAELRAFWEVDSDTGQRADPPGLLLIPDSIKQAFR